MVCVLGGGACLVGEGQGVLHPSTLQVLSLPRRGLRPFPSRILQREARCRVCGGRLPAQSLIRAPSTRRGGEAW